MGYGCMHPLQELNTAVSADRIDPLGAVQRGRLAH